MKITNFHDYIEKRTEPHGYRVAIAKVTVTTYNWLFWTHSEVKEVYLAEGASCWRFTDTGEHTPGNKVEALHASYVFHKEFDALI